MNQNYKNAIPKVYNEIEKLKIELTDQKST